MIPTTDQMDSTTPEERPKLVAMCEKCGTWKPFTLKEHAINTYAGLVCDNDKSTNFRDVISQRTFDAERAKKASAKWLKTRKTNV